MISLSYLVFLIIFCSFTYFLEVIGTLHYHRLVEVGFVGVLDRSDDCFFIKLGVQLRESVLLLYSFVSHSRSYVAPTDWLDGVVLFHGRASLSRHLLLSLAR